MDTRRGAETLSGFFLAMIDIVPSHSRVSMVGTEHGDRAVNYTLMKEAVIEEI